MGCPQKNLHKFKEVGWQVLYYFTAWLCGLYISVLSDEAYLWLYQEEGGWMYWVDHSKCVLSLCGFRYPVACAPPGLGRCGSLRHPHPLLWFCPDGGVGTLSTPSPRA